VQTCWALRNRYRRRRAPAASEPDPASTNIPAAPRASQFTSAPAGPLPVFGGCTPPPAAPPAGVVGAGGTGVFVAGTAVGGTDVFVAGTVAVTVGVAVRTTCTGVHTGTDVLVGVLVGTWNGAMSPAPTAVGV